MHQHPRPSPLTASPASSPRTNPQRTNNPREPTSTAQPRIFQDITGYSEADDGSEDSGGMAAAGPSRDALKKLDQIIQNFHTKAAILVLQSRMSLPVIITKEGTKKVNKWFSIETDDTTAFRDELSTWRNCGGFQNRPPPLILETYIDTSHLTPNQSLVIVDDQGKRWDVLEALNNSSDSNEDGSRQRITEVILERWKIELKDTSKEQTHDFGITLPSVYKNCIVFFRSLYSTAKIVPAWKFVKTLAKGGTPDNQLRVKSRILSGDIPPSRFDTLTHPLYDNSGPVTTDYFLGLTETPVGPFSAEVCYRNDCNFRVDDTKSILNSRFMGVDEYFFQPSLGAKEEVRRTSARATEVGSLPAHRHRSDTASPEPVQAYGSMSTFHGNVRDVPPRGSSPISALRAVNTMGSDTSSPPTNSLPRSRTIQTSRVLDGGAMVRRPSISFQPFKAGSLSSSPSLGHHLGTDVALPQSPQSSLPRGSGISALTQARNRSSLTAGMPATLRGGPVVTDSIVASSGSSSPKPTPMSRYSSSFGHRRGRSSYGGASKVLTDDDQVSSGKQSASSSVQPGSGILAEAGGGSSDSLHTDDESISDFLKLLDSKKTLKSFEKAGNTAAQKTREQLSKFQSMKESHNLLTESMSSSAMLHRSSSSSSRQLSSVPQMVAATSMSISSSPGKPVSPHTPHTPAIPSRLNISDSVEPRRSSYHRNRSVDEDPSEDPSEPSQSNQHGTDAIDIPTSPRPYYPHVRRSSSVAQQHRSLAVDEDLGDLPFGVHRSISLGADDREAPSLSALLGVGQADAVTSPTSPPATRLLQPAPHIVETEFVDQESSLDGQETYTSQAPRVQTSGSLNAPYRPALGWTGGRGITPPLPGSYSNLIERASGSGTSERAGGRLSFTRTAGQLDPDDEPMLLFQMSEIGRDSSRRSVEEPRGGGIIGSTERRGYNLSKGDSRPTSHGGSRRGWPE